MRCQPDNNRRHANPSKARMHWGDYVGFGGGGREIERRLPVGVEERRAE